MVAPFVVDVDVTKNPDRQHTPGGKILADLPAGVTFICSGEHEQRVPANQAALVIVAQGGASETEELPQLPVGNTERVLDLLPMRGELLTDEKPEGGLCRAGGDSRRNV